MLFYPIKPSSVGLIIIITFSIWLAHVKFSLFILQLSAFCVFATAFIKYLFLVFDHTLEGQPSPPKIVVKLFNPFNEWRHIHFIVGMGLISSPISQMHNQTAIVLYSLLVFSLMPAYLGLLCGGRGILAPFNPFKILRFITLAGTMYWPLVIAVGALLQLSSYLYFNSDYTFLAIFVCNYSLVFFAHATARLMHEKRQEMDIIDATGADLEFEQEQKALNKLRNQCLQKIYNRREINTVVTLINQHIERDEQDAFIAHRWFHQQLMQWQDKSCAMAHGKEYISFLRASGKTAAADLLTQQLDPQCSNQHYSSK